MVKVVDATGGTLAHVEAARVFIEGFDFAEVYAHQEVTIYGPGLVDFADNWVVTEASTGARFAMGTTVDDAVSGMKRWMSFARMTPAAWKKCLDRIRTDLARKARH